MANTLKGIVEEVLERKFSKDGTKAYDDFVLKHGSFDFPKYAVFEVTSTSNKPVWREAGLAIDASRTTPESAGLHVGDSVEVSFDVTASKSDQGRWFGLLRAWKIEPLRAQQKTQQQQDRRF